MVALMALIKVSHMVIVVFRMSQTALLLILCFGSFRRNISNHHLLFVHLTMLMRGIDLKVICASNFYFNFHTSTFSHRNYGHKLINPVSATHACYWFDLHETIFGKITTMSVLLFEATFLIWRIIEFCFITICSLWFSDIILLQWRGRTFYFS